MPKVTEWWSRDHTTQVVQLAVSMTVLAAALYVILSGGYEESHQKWAFGMVGLVVGYWLK